MCLNVRHAKSSCLDQQAEHDSEYETCTATATATATVNDRCERESLVHVILYATLLSDAFI